MNGVFMGNLSSDSFMDLSRFFNPLSLKALVLHWHSDMTRADLHTRSLSKFTTRITPDVFFKSLGKNLITPPPVVHVIAPATQSRFVGIALAPTAPEIRKPDFSLVSVAKDIFARIEKIYADIPQAVAEKTATKRTTLTLKNKATLRLKNPPSVLPERAGVFSMAATKVSRDASISELAALFKAEMQAATEKKPEEVRPQTAAQNVIVEKRGTSGKSWADLTAAADAFEKKARTPKSGIDLAAAFKSEMQSLLAEKDKEIVPRSQASKAPRKVA